MMKANETPHEMSLQEKVICLVLTGKKPELPYPLKEVECADGTVQRIYQIPDENKAKVLADLYPFDGGTPSIDDTHYDIHERKPSKVRDFLVIRWGEGNLLASPFFPQSGGILADWVNPDKIKTEAPIVDGKMSK